MPLSIPRLRHYKNVLLLSSCEQESLRYKRAMEMFGVAGHVHTESNEVSAMYHLSNTGQMPDLVIASLDDESSTLRFMQEYEKLPGRNKLNSSVVVLYEKEKQVPDPLKGYRQLKKPLCVPELCDTRDYHEQLLN